MKILMLTDFYPPTIGGVERHVENLSRCLVRRGHEVTVCTPRQRGLEPGEDASGVQVRRLRALYQELPFLATDPRKQYHPPLTDPRLKAGLRRVVDEFDPDVVHSHGWILFSYLPVKTAAPVVSTLHHYGFLCPRQDLFYRGEAVCDKPFTWSCYRCAAQHYNLVKATILSEWTRRNRGKVSLVDRFFAVSRFVQAVHVKHLNASRDKFSLIPNFYVGEAVDGKPRDEALPDNFILYVGALTPLKGVDLLLDAYRRVDPDVPLVLIGAKHPAYTYRRFHDGDRVILIEDAPRHLVLQAYERCRFVVIPSRWPDPCPTVAFEAMTHGKAILASNVGGLPDLVVHAKTGYLFPPDEDALCHALRAVLQQPGIDEMGAAGRNRFAARYTLEKVVPRIESAYRALR